MRRFGWLGCVLCACTATESVHEQGSGSVVARFSNAATLRGDAWTFLFDRGQGFPGAPVAPRHVSSASDGRRERGDERIVLASVAAGVFRSWGFVDSNPGFDPWVDVLAQPGYGDHVATTRDIVVRPGSVTTVEFDATTRIDEERPAFRTAASASVESLGTVAGPLRTVDLVAEAVNPQIDSTQVGFNVGWVDRDDDGQPDDANGDGLPDTTPQFFLHWKPRPGQLNEGADVIVPLFPNYLSTVGSLLAGTRARTRIASVRLLALGNAQSVTQVDGGVEARTLSAAPAGDYELVVLSETGLFWRVPNDLGKTVGHQGTVFRISAAAP